MSRTDLENAIRQCRKNAESYARSARQAFQRGNYELGDWYAERCESAEDHARDLARDL